jgi:hypothetical protein
MSGGHYDYAYGRVRDLADAIYSDVQKHSKTFIDDYGETVTAFPQAVLDAMRRCAAALEAAATAARDVEWLMSGDYGEDSFLEAAKEWNGEKVVEYVLKQLRYGGTQGGLSENECRMVHDKVLELT